jgi:hypothetical protein
MDYLLKISLVGRAARLEHGVAAGLGVRWQAREELSRDPQMPLVVLDNAGGEHHYSAAVAIGSVLRTPVPFGGVQVIPPSPPVHQFTRTGMCGRRVPTLPPRGFPLEAAGSSLSRPVPHHLLEHCSDHLHSNPRTTSNPGSATSHTSLTIIHIIYCVSDKD